MEQMLNRNGDDEKLFNDIYDFFPRKERIEKSEMWDLAKKVKENNSQAELRPSRNFLCPLSGQQGKSAMTAAEMKQRQYKYLKPAGKLSTNRWNPNLFGPDLGKFIISCLTPKPEQPKADFALVVDWGVIGKETLDAVSGHLPVDPQPRVRDMENIYQQVCTVADAVNAELKDLQHKLSLDARGEMISLAIIHTWQRMSQAAWEERMKPIDEFKAEEEKQREYFRSQVLQSPEADREMATRWITDIVEMAVDQKMLIDAGRMVEAETAKSELSLCRRTIEEDLDNLLGSDDLDKQEQYIANPKSALKQELQRRFSKIVSPRIKKREQDLLAEVEDILHFLRSELRALCDHPELQAEKAIVEAQDFASDPRETEYIRKQAVAKWMVSSLTMDCDLPVMWSVDEAGQLEACDDKRWQIKMSQFVPSASPVKDENLRRWVQASHLNIWTSAFTVLSSCGENMF